MDWQTIALIVLGVLSIVLGIKWQQVKHLIKEGAEALTELSGAIEDDKLTKEELRALAREWGDVILAFRKLIGK